MARDKHNWLSTGEVADLFGIAPRTVTKWVDRGWLSSQYLPTGNAIHGKGFRRIPRTDVIRFARERGFPEVLTKMGVNGNRVLTVGTFGDLAGPLAGVLLVLGTTPDFVPDAVSAIAAVVTKPDTRVVICGTLVEGTASMRSLASYLRSHREDITLLALLPDDTDAETLARVRLMGWTCDLANPIDFIREAVYSATSDPV